MKNKFKVLGVLYLIISFVCLVALIHKGDDVFLILSALFAVASTLFFAIEEVVEYK